MNSHSQVHATPYSSVIYGEAAFRSDNPLNDCSKFGIQPLFKGYIDSLNNEFYETGPKGISEFLSKNLIFPEIAKVNGIEGRVIVQFLVSENGILKDISIVAGLIGGCSEEAIRLVKIMSDKKMWSPAIQNGNNLICRHSLSILFKL